MIAAICFITKMFDSIHLVYDKTDLMARDKKDFEDYWELLDRFDNVFYHDKLPTPKKGDLIIVDEADVFIFSDPALFAKIIESCACICFTATPHDGDKQGSEL